MVLVTPQGSHTCPCAGGGGLDPRWKEDAMTPGAQLGAGSYQESLQPLQGPDCSPVTLTLDF